jgi:CheY-like chemotaxis protein/anti-sigma regulatory factor (Ser/Thr protein kinase)
MDRSTPPRKHVLVVEDDRVLRLALSRLLAEAHAVDEAADGPTALAKLEQGRFDLVLLDIGLPGLNGLDVLTRVHAAGNGKAPRVVVMTADDTPETLLRAIRQQAYDYVVKPFPPSAILDIAARALAAPDDALAIQVLSARPDWVELLVPCSLDVADRLQNFMMRLETGLPEDVRESVGMAFRELLCNAIEWGGRLDATRQVRIACLRAKRMVLYRIADPGEGFRIEELSHAAISNAPDRPLDHAIVREQQGLRAGGFGLFLVRQMVDELLYNEARNEVVFVKYLD